MKRLEKMLGKKSNRIEPVFMWPESREPDRPLRRSRSMPLGFNCTVKPATKPTTLAKRLLKNPFTPRQPNDPVVQSTGRATQPIWKGKNRAVDPVVQTTMAPGKPIWNPRAAGTDPAEYANRPNKPAWTKEKIKMYGPLKEQKITLQRTEDTGALADQPKNVGNLTKTRAAPTLPPKDKPRQPTHDDLYVQYRQRPAKTTNPKPVQKNEQPPVRRTNPVAPVPVPGPSNPPTLSQVLPLGSRDAVPAEDLLPEPVFLPHEHVQRVREAHQAKLRPPVQIHEYSNVQPGVLTFEYSDGAKKGGDNVKKHRRNATMDDIKPEMLQTLIPAHQRSESNPNPIPPSQNLRAYMKHGAAAVHRDATQLGVVYGASSPYATNTANAKAPAKAKEIPKSSPMGETQVRTSAHQVLRAPTNTSPSPRASNRGNTKEISKAVPIIQPPTRANANANKALQMSTNGTPSPYNPKPSVKGKETAKPITIPLVQTHLRANNTRQIPKTPKSYYSEASVYSQASAFEWGTETASEAPTTSSICDFYFEPFVPTMPTMPLNVPKRASPEIGPSQPLQSTKRSPGHTSRMQKDLPPRPTEDLARRLYPDGFSRHMPTAYDSARTTGGIHERVQVKGAVRSKFTPRAEFEFGLSGSTKPYKASPLGSSSTARPSPGPSHRR
ncbi:hypothetical protein BDN70DRAFT_919300 [Pholiota conissans]|uniref:Uncharacterized protein n=1 Tax=Pholiota conissans TaxID=109636 RepID=A0A9P5Z6C4_9AGAR|nr:hypothetical protein BDN70DRAFT_919300 [Pholiota conissans]